MQYNSYLYKQHCIIGLARTCKYNAHSKFMYIVCLQALMNVGYVHTICDRACKNQPCECKQIAHFSRLCSIITY